MEGSISSTSRLGAFQQMPVRSQPRQILAVKCSAAHKGSQATPATKQSPTSMLAGALAAAGVLSSAAPPAMAAHFAPQLEAQATHAVCSMSLSKLSNFAYKIATTDLKAHPEEVFHFMTAQELSKFVYNMATIAEVATDLKFEPEKAVGGPGLSAAQEAASRANPPPFDPAVIGGTAGLLLLAFGIGTGRADPQLKMNSSSGGSSGASGGGSAGSGEDGAKVAEVQGRKKQARAWIGDWQKRTKKQ